jgi:hypothetical protein
MNWLASKFSGSSGAPSDLKVEESAEGGAPVAANDTQRNSLWSMLSGMVGKDVTSGISLPVWIFEPLSFSQVMCEPMQYGDLLFQAAAADSTINRLAYLTAWIVGGYSMATRTKKPFNPLLGETFEYIDKDNRWRFFAEQVSHHPPVCVARVESDPFTLELEMGVRSHFRGNSVDVDVEGGNRIWFQDSNEYITWGHLNTTAYNVILGSMTIDHYGELDIVNHSTGDKAVLKLSKMGWTSGSRYQMHAEIFDSKGKLRMKLNGRWNDKIEATRVSKEGESDPILLWRSEKAPDNKWRWTDFTASLNKFDDAYRKQLPATDARLRADRLALEQGDFDKAGAEKARLENEQRARKKERDDANEAYKPRFFAEQDDKEAGHGTRWTYVGKYWEERDVPELADIDEDRYKDILADESAEIHTDKKKAKANAKHEKREASKREKEAKKLQKQKRKDEKSAHQKAGKGVAAH